MTKAQIKEKLEKEDKGTFVIEIIHKNKKYVQAIKPTKKSFEYIYYEIKDNNLELVLNEEILQELKGMYERKASNIIY